MTQRNADGREERERKYTLNSLVRLFSAPMTVQMQLLLR